MSGRSQTALRVAFLLLGLALVANLLQAECSERGLASRPDWWQADRDAVAALREAGDDWPAIVREQRQKEPLTEGEAYFQINLFLRAGMQAEAVTALEHLRRICKKPEAFQLNGIYYAATDQYKSWIVARRLVEIFADAVYELSLNNRLIHHLLKEGGWTVEEIDEWLAVMSARSAAESDRDSSWRRRPPGDWRKYWHGDPSLFWLWARLKFRAEQKNAETLLRELENGIRHQPEDVAQILRYLSVLPPEVGHGRDLAWLPDTVRVSLARDAYDLGLALSSFQQWAAAAAFYRFAIRTPLRDQDLQRLANYHHYAASKEGVQVLFDVTLREKLAAVLLELGEHQEAQRWMVAAADLRRDHELGSASFLAGMAQAASGRRVIEGRILEAEEKTGDDPEYWLERAWYYGGRGEAVQEQHALEQGLARASRVAAEGDQKAARQRRALLDRYSRFLLGEDRDGEAFQFLREEIAHSPSSSPSAAEAVRHLATFFKDSIDPQDELLWNWLAGQESWSGSRLLGVLLESASPARIDPSITRAERLCAEGDWTRAHALGEWLKRKKYFARSIPHLRRVVQETPDVTTRQIASHDLFDANLAVGDWREAEALLQNDDEAQTRPSRWVDLALGAAREGAQEHALRFWSLALALDFTQTKALDALADYDLREELVVLYRRLQVELPTSEIPARALRILTRG